VEPIEPEDMLDEEELDMFELEPEVLLLLLPLPLLKPIETAALCMESLIP